MIITLDIHKFCDPQENIVCVDEMHPKYTQVVGPFTKTRIRKEKRYHKNIRKYIRKWRNFRKALFLNLSRNLSIYILNRLKGHRKTVLNFRYQYSHYTQIMLPYPPKKCILRELKKYQKKYFKIKDLDVFKLHISSIKMY